MSNYEAIKALIAQTSGQKNTLTIPKIYVELTGDLTTALLLNRIVFYSNESKRNDGFFYKTYKDWEREILLTERQVRNSANKLKKNGANRNKSYESKRFTNSSLQTRLRQIGRFDSDKEGVTK